MINRQNPSERAQLKEGSDALDGARVATPAISDFYNNICQKRLSATVGGNPVDSATYVRSVNPSTLSKQILVTPVYRGQLSLGWAYGAHGDQKLEAVFHGDRQTVHIPLW
jgi:hypothetical protein